MASIESFDLGRFGRHERELAGGSFWDAGQMLVEEKRAMRRVQADVDAYTAEGLRILTITERDGQNILTPSTPLFSFLFSRISQRFAAGSVRRRGRWPRDDGGTPGGDERTKLVVDVTHVSQPNLDQRRWIAPSRLMRFTFLVANDSD